MMTMLMLMIQSNNAPENCRHSLCETSRCSSTRWRTFCTSAPSIWSNYSRVMARILAVMHWLAEIDANSIEFVLAPPRSSPIPSESGCPAIISNVLGEHTVWVLDFDCCRKTSMDEDGVKQAVKAFMSNDHYYPRPKASQALWAFAKNI